MELENLEEASSFHLEVLFMTWNSELEKDCIDIVHTEFAINLFYKKKINLGFSDMRN